ESKLWSLLFSADAKSLLAEDERGTVKLWNLETGEERTAQGPSDPAGLALTPDGKVVALLGWKTLTLLDVASGQKRSFPCTNPSVWVSSVAFAPDGKTLAVGLTDWQRVEYSTASRQGFTNSDNRQYTKSYHQFLQIWDVAAGENRILQGHDGGISALAFSPDA